MFFDITHYNETQQKALKEFFDKYYKIFACYLSEDTYVCLDIRQDKTNPYFCFYDHDYDIIFCKDFNDRYSLEYRKQKAPKQESFAIEGTSDYCLGYLKQKLCQIGTVVLDEI